MEDNLFDNIKIEFEQFLSVVGNVLAHDKEINLIQNKLRRHFNKAPSNYLCSKGFQSFLENIHNFFVANEKSTKYFNLLSSLDEQLKKHRVKLLKSHQPSPKASDQSNEKHVTSSLLSSGNIQITTERTTEQHFDECKDRQSDSNEFRAPTVNEQLNKTQEKKIKKLERRLSHLSKTIRGLEEKDMSLDEMEYCDLYVVESDLKKRAYEIYERILRLKNESKSSIARILYQPVTLTETEIDHPLINKTLEHMINRTNFLPCFHDVLDTIGKTNDKYKLNLSDDDRKNYAEKAFKIIGKKIKNRRMADFDDIMISRLPENFNIEQNDPALNNVEMEKVLLENQREAIIKTAKLFDSFSQIDPSLEPEIDIESAEEPDIHSATKDEVDSENESISKSSNSTVDEIEYDIVDILPPFSSTSPSPERIVELEAINNETPVEISLNNPTLRISSTASIPLKRVEVDLFSTKTKITESDIYTVSDNDTTEEPQPACYQHVITGENVYNHCAKPSSNYGMSVAQKRTSSNDFESSKSKKRSKFN